MNPILFKMGVRGLVRVLKIQKNLIFLPVIIAFLLTACGAGNSGGNTESGTTNNNESKSIGPNGGVVTSSNGKAKVIIPTGALNQATDITVAAISNQPSGNIGTAYELGPDGTTFSQPVTIFISYDETSLPPGVSESDIKLGVVTNNQWQAIPDSKVDTVSNIVSGTTTHLSTYGIMAVSIGGTAPSVPAGVTAMAGDGQVAISWNAVSGASAYNIYWSTTPGVTKSTGTKIANITSPYSHSGRTNGTTYYYVITAVNGYGESVESSQVLAMPSATGTAPSIPTGVTASAGDGQVTISWNAVPGATSYNIYWSTTSGMTKATGTRISNVTSPYVHTGRTNGTTYYYVVTAVNNYGEGVESSQASAMPSATGTAPSIPTGVTASAGDGQVTISWNAVPGATSYDIYWSTTSSVTKATGTRISNVTSPYVHTGRTNGTTYYYVVTAVNGYGESGESSQVSAAPVAVVSPDTTAPFNNTTGTNFINSGASATNSTSVTLSLYAIDNIGVTGYYASESSITPSLTASGWTLITTTASYSSSVPFILSSGDGTKAVYVWFKDAAGNVSAPASGTITLDTVSPDTTITSQPDNPTNSTSASFSFTSTEADSTFQCQMDSNGYSACTSPKSYSGLAGSHTFSVKAVDPAGNMDSTPASYTWTAIDITAPSNTTTANFINGGAAYTNSTSVALSISATDDVGVTGYYLSGSSITPSAFAAGWTTITSTPSYSALISFTMGSGDGTKTVYVWFKDMAGNVSASVSDTIALDTVLPTTGTLSATPDNTQVSLSWSGFSDAGSGIATYKLVYSTADILSSCSNGTQIYSGIGTAYNHPDLLHGIKYYYRLCAVDNAGNSSAGATASAATIKWSLLKLPDTGQTGDYTATFGEDSDYNINPPSYTDNGNGTITDNVSGLMWQKEDDNVTRTWMDAMTYCDSLTLGGYSDWWLPSKKELISIVNYGAYNPSIDTTYFPNTDSSYYWSSTVYTTNSVNVWYMNFYYGDFANSSVQNIMYARCVRGGK